MSNDIQTVIQALSRAVEQSHKNDPQRSKPVLTISRDFGCGGGEICKLLAERLDLEIFDENVINAIAQRAEVNCNLLKNLHERINSASESWLYAMVSGKNVSREEYVSALITVIRSIYHKGGLIVGRGAHVVLQGRNILRVRLTGSMEACSRRIAHRERLSLSEAKMRCEEVNKERAQFVWNMFSSRLNDPVNFDLTINTDQFASPKHIVEIIANAMEMTGHHKRNVENLEI